GSLILLDEFGAGTDPSQGAALAQAVLDELIERGACAVAATHFPALKSYALTREHVRAASVLFDPATKKPLFRLAYDQVGASLALDAAREHGLPECVLRRAEHYLLLDGQDMSAVMDRLNALAAAREKELDHLREEEGKTREKREQYKARFEKERERIHTEVRGMAMELMNAWKSGKSTARQALKEMSRLRASLAPQAAPEPEAPPQKALDIETLSAGQTVIHRPWNKKAVILEVDARQKRVKLDMNGVSLWVQPELIALSDAPGKGSQPASRGSIVQKSDEEIPFLRLDVRGKRADLAISEIERFLDRAILSGRDGAEILHGRGTGALRKQIHQFLREFPGVASYAVANEDQGGDGVTIVTFR
ncbi:MAG: Smr/MutS family protein, partial [Desulfovibrionaceae bacterium]|nr:Smr/MutS family protein [Desulfovibrionaceae bacterium]